MGLILKPSEVKNCTKQMRSQLESNRNSYAGALQTVQKFAGNDSLKSESWDTMKEKVIVCHQAISAGMQAATDVMIADSDKLESAAEGDDLDEDLLMKTIMCLEEECIQYETTIQTLLQLQASLPPGTYNSINQYIKKCREMLERTREELVLVKEMLNLLYQKTEQTSELFQTIGTLLGAVECAINDAEVYISGRGTLSDESWRTVIPDMVEKYYTEKSVSDLENFLYKELEITIDDFKGLYGEEIINDICESASKKGIGGIGGKSRDEVITIILEQTSGQKVAKVDDKYQFLYGADKVMLEFEQDKAGEIIMDVAYANTDVKKRYIADYLKEHLPECDDIHIAAIMGNMQTESQFSPLISEGYSEDLYNPEYIERYDINDGIGWGLVQWTYHTRKKGLKEYADKKGENSDKSFLGDMDTQLEYLVIEFKGEVSEGGKECKVGDLERQYNKFIATDNLADATEYFCKEIERPNNESAHLPERKKYATEIYNELVKESIGNRRVED